MLAYIQTNQTGDFYNVNAYIANEGFQTLGWETRRFFTLDELSDPDPEIVVVGGIANVRGRLSQLGIALAESEMDYPEELVPFLGRKIWTTTLEELVNNEDQWNVFAKPQQETKKFAGKVFRSYADFAGLIDRENPTVVWCSEVVEFLTEWRCFIRYGEILDVRRYKGRWDTQPDTAMVEQVVVAFRNAPAAYALDVGLDKDGAMKLVEINDGHSLGTYGIGAVNYARFLSARWAQLTGTKDYLR